MSLLQGLVRELARDGVLEVDDVRRVRAELPPGATTRAELKRVLDAYEPILTPEAAAALRAMLPRPRLGELVASGLARLRGERRPAERPAVRLFAQPELASVRARRQTLGVGAKGDGVRHVQRGLMHLARLTSSSALLPLGGASGEYDEETTRAVASFQLTFALPPSGRVDQDTLRTLDAALDAAREPLPAVLTRAVLAGEPELTALLTGGSPLARGAKGPAVAALQRALLACGFQPRGGADGLFGPSTEGALRGLQRSVGLPPTGVLDARTLAALDRETPPPGGGRELWPEYDRLFARGSLEVTVAVGFDEGGAGEELEAGARADLALLGLRPLPSTDTAAELTALGIDPTQLAPGVEHFLGVGLRTPGPVVVHLITPTTVDAARRFEQALVDSDVVIYAGHGRRGTGPDFDALGSPEGNYVIDADAPRAGGPMSSLAATVARSTHVLARTPFHRDHYQLLLLAACSSADYLRALRTVADQKDTSNLDVLVTRRPLDPTEARRAVRGVLSGLLALAPLSGLLVSADPLGDLVVPDGFADNRRPR
jgi:peptidoglycan hydrolase-like protein with peptidoglycan-binding domain